jgi:hypothetical protein
MNSRTAVILEILCKIRGTVYLPMHDPFPVVVLSTGNDPGIVAGRQK